MQSIPRLKIELEGVRQSIQHMFSANDEALKEMIATSIENTITEKWVPGRIKQEVDRLIDKSIANLSDNWDLKNAIRDLIAIEITNIIKKEK